jgi:hypothetical protein
MFRSLEKVAERKALTVVLAVVRERNGRSEVCALSRLDCRPNLLTNVLQTVRYQQQSIQILSARFDSINGSTEDFYL